MRNILLASVTLFGLACSPALAQTASSEPGAPSDAGTAVDAPAATSRAAPTKPVHHRAVKRVADSDGQTFAHEPGTGESGPASSTASNISEADSHSAIAPHLPAPPGGMNAGPWNYLRDADRALAHHQTGQAQQALEMAETRLLDRSTPVDQANQPAQGPEIIQVNQARKALGAGDIAGARSAIHTALAGAPAGAGSAN